MSKMNLPNKLTIFRVILIVPFIILLLGGQAGWFGDNTFVTDMIALADRKSTRLNSSHM